MGDREKSGMFVSSGDVVKAVLVDEDWLKTSNGLWLPIVKDGEMLFKKVGDAEFLVNCCTKSCTCWWGKHDQCIAAAVEYHVHSHKPGSVHVTGAGTSQVNGWYRKRKARDGPPRVWKKTRENNRKWLEWTQESPWFEKDDGGFIFRVDDGGDDPVSWLCHSTHWYFVESEADLPPAEGWKCYPEKNLAPRMRVTLVM